MTDKPRFHVIDGIHAPDTPKEAVKRRVRKMPKPGAMVQCYRCSGREVIETKIGVILKDGKPTGGTKQLLCAGCLIRGERVVLCF